MDWEGNFSEQTLERGYDYFQRGLVHDFTQQDDGTLAATVFGTEAYQVTVKLNGNRLEKAECDCPYAAGGHKCKHMVAVLDYYENKIDPATFDDDDEYDWDDYDEDDMEAEETDDDKDDFASSIPTTREAIDMASNAQIREFLKYALTRNPELAVEFQMRTNKTVIKRRNNSYRGMIDDIFSMCMDASGFIDYDTADLFERQLSDFIDKYLKPMIEEGQGTLAFKLTSYLVEELAEVDIDDSNGEIVMLADETTDLLKQILDEADLPLKRIIFKWCQKHATEKFGAFEEVVEDILFDNFEESEFLQKKLTWTADKLLQQAQLNPGSWMDHRTAEKWASYHLQVMQELKTPEEAIKQFCLENLYYAKLRTTYVAICVKQQNYDEAIRVLIDGQQSTPYPGTATNFGEQLKRIYLKLGQTENYLDELTQLETVYNPANLEDFQELEKAYSATEWPKARQKLFDAMPAGTDLKRLYVEDELYDQLMDTVSKETDLFRVRDYEPILKQKYPDRMLQHYVDVIQTMASYTNTRRNYWNLVEILRHMRQYPDGKQVTSEIVADWRKRYGRRPAMMEELDRL